MCEALPPTLEQNTMNLGGYMSIYLSVCLSVCLSVWHKLLACLAVSFDKVCLLWGCLTKGVC